MTIACPNCGKPNAANHRFCSNCGFALASAATPQGQDPAATLALGTQSTPSGGDQPESSMAYVVKKSEAPEAASQPVSNFYDSSSAPTQPYVLPSAHTPAPAAPPTAPGFQGYSPTSIGAARREGAAFVPYSGSAAAAIEKPRDQRSWLVPVIIGAAVVLLGLVLISAYLVVSGKSGTASPNPPAQNSGSASSESDMSQPSPTALPANASDELKLRDVIYRSNENQIESWKNLDESVLKKSYTGKALDENINQVRDLQRQGMYAVPHNESLEILDVTVTGDTAIAHTKEKWTVIYYNKANNALITRQSYSLTETYHFVKQNGTWYINQLDIPETTPGTSG